ncbi:MAG: HEPN domain-containing protein [Clostridiales bacterium]|nr:HEPN domain-containing protein [Clostridiales bacterium]
MALNTYFDFAENDYEFFRKNYEDGTVANSMGSLAQSICERYMKHIVSEYFDPEDVNAENRMGRVLRTHSLANLISFLRRDMDIYFSSECESQMRIIDGYYFTTRYPGEDSIELEQSDVENCMAAVTSCRNETISVCEQFEDFHRK